MPNEMLENSEVVEDTTPEVTEEVTETVITEEEGLELTDTSQEEVQTEQPKMYTEEELQERLNDVVQKRIIRNNKKHEAELRAIKEKYAQTEVILNAGLETETIEEANERLAEFYREQGIDIPQPKSEPNLNEREIEALAKLDAQEVMDAGIEEMTDEANRLAEKGYANLTQRERIVFNTLAETLTLENKKKDLIKLGASKELLNDSNFKTFMSKFTPQTPIDEIYNLYKANTSVVKETPQPIGSMKNTKEQKIKDYYSPEEASRLTEKDLDDPKVMKTVELSMQKWSRQA